MILDPNDPTVQRWLSGQATALSRCAARVLARQRQKEAQLAKAIAHRPATGVYATATERPVRYWQEVLRQSAARRRLDKQLARKA